MRTLARRDQGRFSATSAPPEPETQAYLDQLTALATELEAGMHAIRLNALSGFQASVCRQLSLCEVLQTRSTEYERQRQAKPSVSHSDSLLRARAKDAERSLAALNERYKALLKHSGDSLKLFAGFYKSYGAHAPLVGDTRSSGAGWML